MLKGLAPTSPLEHVLLSRSISKPSMSMRMPSMAPKIGHHENQPKVKPLESVGFRKPKLGI